MQRKATEYPGTGVLIENKADGTYVCGQCGVELFLSDHKYDSGSGWPAFHDAANIEALEFKNDLSYGMVRTEVSCKACGGHLGHVFDVDKSNSETGKWYCINSCSLDFESADKRTRINGDGSRDG